MEDDPDEEHAKWSCGTMRKKIATFLATKEMTQTAFLKACGGIAPNSFGNFMKLKGDWNGTQNGTFWGAQRFFIAREAEAKAAKAAEKMLPTAEKKRKRDADADGKQAKKTALAALLEKARSTVLPANQGVFDSCDEVRKKSLEFMASTGMTQTAFIKVASTHCATPATRHGPSS